MSAPVMRLYYLIGIIALVAQGCDASQPAPDRTLSQLLVGTWDYWQSNGLQNVRIELRAGGQYELWTPYLQSDLTAKTMIHSGTWSVHERTLLLHIQKGFIGHIPTGLSLSYDITSASPAAVLLSLSPEKLEAKWTRVLEKAEPFWKGALSYEPPFRMSSYLHPADAGTAVGDWELFSTAMGAGTNGPTQVVFHLGTVTEFIGTDSPAKALETVADLKSFMDSKLKANPRDGNSFISVINIDGREALMSITPTNQFPGQPIKWWGGVCFFWEAKPVWQDSTICSITMTAETPGTFNLLTNSLKTVKVLGRKQKN